MPTSYPRLLVTASVAVVSAISTWATPLARPASGERLRVAFVMTDGANVIDHAGPWEVFQDTVAPDGGPAFQLYTVSDRTEPIRATAGLVIVPHYTFATAPEPHVVVVGAQGGRSPAMRGWLMRQSKRADVILGVCTGVAKLASIGLLDGKEAATHHDFVTRFNRQYPNVKFLAGRRFVQSDDVILTAGGLTSGIDGALHVVQRYFGTKVAQSVAAYMEYASEGWKEGVPTPDS